MADNNARKRKVEELEKRVQALEQASTTHGERLDKVELRLEEVQAYRFIRIEGCTRMDYAGKDAQDGSTPRKAHELSSGRRVVPALAAREAAATAFDLTELVEWVSKDSIV